MVKFSARVLTLAATWRVALTLSLTLPLVFGGLRVTAAQEKAVPAESKQWKFAVVSIRKNQAGPGTPQQLGAAAPDGYQMKNLFLGYLVAMAYVPQTGGAAYYTPGQIIGMPAWLSGDDDHYDVDAKVDEADLADWQNPAKQPVMLRSMLQAMLEDRLKLVVHRSTKEAPVYLLVVGKNGPTFKETDPSDPHAGSFPGPGGIRMSMERNDDQVTLHFFGISMAQLASLQLSGAGRLVQDKTGLTGRYDITIRRPAPPVATQPGVQQGGISAPDLQPSAASIAEQLGLNLEPVKGQVETLVIDHVERPSPN